MKVMPELNREVCLILSKPEKVCERCELSLFPTSVGSVNPVEAIYLRPEFSVTLCLHILLYKRKKERKKETKKETKKERDCIAFLLLKRWVWKILRNLVCMWLVANLIRVGQQLPT